MQLFPDGFECAWLKDEIKYKAIMWLCIILNGTILAPKYHTEQLCIDDAADKPQRY